MKHYTYILFDEHDNFYIGSHSCKDNKEPASDGYMGSGRAISSGEFVPICKQVLSLFMSREEAGLEEKLLIMQADYKNNPRCFNKVCAGINHSDESRANISKSRKGMKLSEEHKANIGKSVTGELNGFYGETHSEESRQKMSDTLAGKWLSEEHKTKLSELISGENHPNFGKKLSEETKAKIIDSRLNPKIYKFVHEDGREHAGLIKELLPIAKELFGISGKSVLRLRDEPNKIVKGWRCAGVVG